MVKQVIFFYNEGKMIELILEMKIENILLIQFQIHILLLYLIIMVQVLQIIIMLVKT